MTPVDWVADELAQHKRAGTFQWRSFFLGFQVGRLSPPLTEPKVRSCVAAYLAALGYKRKPDST
jgi:hypothetical protein